MRVRTFDVYGSPLHCEQDRRDSAKVDFSLWHHSMMTPLRLKEMRETLMPRLTAGGGDSSYLVFLYKPRSSRTCAVLFSRRSGRKGWCTARARASAALMHRIAWSHLRSTLPGAHHNTRIASNHEADVRDIYTSAPPLPFCNNLSEKSWKEVGLLEDGSSRTNICVT